ncbi:MAG: 4Fe-4S cluster-binding domain-containing protein [Planctomycetaceae bacterium]|nr:4Fe-4S cluster-binding domain-containing protein [Planctomycetaceae bacterium]
MHTVGKYIYDPNRLIFYQNGYDTQTVEKIIKPNDHYESLFEKLSAYNADEIQIKPGALHRAGICLTNNCNFRCNYCVDSSVDGNEELLTIEDIIVFVSDVMKRWTINKLLGRAEEPLRLNFTGGGEPTYNWNLFTNAVLQIRQKCLDNNISFHLGITTNGLLDDLQRVFIAKKCDSVMVSYDGIPEIQERNRLCVHDSRTSESVEETIRFFSKVPINLTVRTTIWQSDFCRLKEIADYVFGNFGTSVEWSILPVIPTGRAMNRVRKEHEKFSKSDFLTSYLNFVEYARDKYGSVSISTPVFQGTLNTFYCGAISVYSGCPWLMPDRTIITCIESCDVKTTIGKIEGNEVVYFEKCADPLFKVYQQKFDECRSCIAYRFCKGGCPVRHLANRNARTTMDDWECTMIQKYWTYIFENILEGKECLGWCVKPVEIDGLEGIEVLKLTKV